MVTYFVINLKLEIGVLARNLSIWFKVKIVTLLFDPKYFGLVFMAVFFGWLCRTQTIGYRYLGKRLLGEHRRDSHQYTTSRMARAWITFKYTLGPIRQWGKKIMGLKRKQICQVLHVFQNLIQKFRQTYCSSKKFYQVFQFLAPKNIILCHSTYLSHCILNHI